MVVGLHELVSNGVPSYLLVVEKWWIGAELYQRVVFVVCGVVFLGVLGVFWVFFL